MCNANSAGFYTHTTIGIAEVMQKPCLFNLEHWNIQQLQVYETVAAICAPAFSPSIVAEHKANIRTNMCEKCQNRLSTVLCVAHLNIA